jgi:hypothetical protein
VRRFNLKGTNKPKSIEFGRIITTVNDDGEIPSQPKKITLID